MASAFNALSLDATVDVSSASLVDGKQGNGAKNGDVIGECPSRLSAVSSTYAINPEVFPGNHLGFTGPTQSHRVGPISHTPSGNLNYSCSTINTTTSLQTGTSSRHQRRQVNASALQEDSVSSNDNDEDLGVVVENTSAHRMAQRWMLPGPPEITHVLNGMACSGDVSIHPGVDSTVSEMVNSSSTIPSTGDSIGIIDTRRERKATVVKKVTAQSMVMVVEETASQRMAHGEGTADMSARETAVAIVHAEPEGGSLAVTPTVSPVEHAAPELVDDDISESSTSSSPLEYSESFESSDSTSDTDEGPCESEVVQAAAIRSRAALQQPPLARNSALSRSSDEEGSAVEICEDVRATRESAATSGFQSALGVTSTDARAEPQEEDSAVIEGAARATAARAPPETHTKIEPEAVAVPVVVGKVEVLSEQVSEDIADSECDADEDGGAPLAILPSVGPTPWEDVAPDAFAAGLLDVATSAEKAHQAPTVVQHVSAIGSDTSTAPMGEESDPPKADKVDSIVPVQVAPRKNDLSGAKEVMEEASDAREEVSSHNEAAPVVVEASAPAVEVAPVAATPPTMAVAPRRPKAKAMPAPPRSPSKRGATQPPPTGGREPRPGVEKKGAVGNRGRSSHAKDGHSAGKPAGVDARRRVSRPPASKANVVIPTYHDEWTGKSNVDDKNAMYQAILHQRKVDEFEQVSRRLGRVKSRIEALRRRLRGEAPDDTGAAIPTPPSPVSQDDLEPHGSLGQNAVEDDAAEIVKAKLEENRVIEQRLARLRKEHGASTTSMISSIIRQIDLELKAKSRELMQAQREIDRIGERRRRNQARKQSVGAVESPKRGGAGRRAPIPTSPSTPNSSALQQRIADARRRKKEAEEAVEASMEKIHQLHLGGAGTTDASVEDYIQVLFQRNRNEAILAKLREAVACGSAAQPAGGNATTPECAGHQAGEAAPRLKRVAEVKPRSRVAAVARDNTEKKRHPSRSESNAVRGAAAAPCHSPSKASGPSAPPIGGPKRGRQAPPKEGDEPQSVSPTGAANEVEASGLKCHPTPAVPPVSPSKPGVGAHDGRRHTSLPPHNREATRMLPELGKKDVRKVRERRVSEPLPDLHKKKDGVMTGHCPTVDVVEAGCTTPPVAISSDEPTPKDLQPRVTATSVPVTPSVALPALKKLLPQLNPSALELRKKQFLSKSPSSMHPKKL